MAIIFLIAELLLAAACAPKGSPGPLRQDAQEPSGLEENSVIQVANEDVVSGKLGVKVFAHRIEQVRCWTYATAGLWALGQRELLLSVKRDPAEGDGAFPREPLGFFRMVYKFAEQKRLVHEGGVTLLSDQSAPLLSASSFRGVLYAAPQSLKGIPIAAPYLTAILVTREELQAAMQYGHARILGRLGQSVRYFPTPPWADRHRAPVVGANEKESILGRAIPRMAVRGATVRQEGGSNDVGPGAFAEALVTPAQRRVVLELAPGAPSLMAALSKLPESAQFALLTALDANGGAAFVWHPGDQSPSAITKYRQVDSIGGNFVLFTPSADRQGAGRVEDGFAVFLHEALFQGLKQALVEGKPLAVEPSGDLMGFSIRILTTVYSDPISGVDFIAEGGWKLYQPHEPRAASKGPVAADEIILLTPEPEVGRLISANALAQFGLAIETALQEIAGATKPMRGRDLLVDTTIEPGGRKTFKVAARPPEDLDSFVLELYEKLEKIPAPSIPDGSIHFQSKFRLWGGRVSVD